MELWSPCFLLLQGLRPAFHRTKTWYWFLVVVIGMTVRWGDKLGGVSSVMRKCWLDSLCYRNLLHFFHSSAVDVALLRKKWSEIVLKNFPVFRVNGRIVLIADGIKIPKEGRKMPGVKLLHQESNNNSKPEWVMGHMCQSIGVLVSGMQRFFCVPLSTQIHDGIITSNRDKKTLHDKLMNLIQSLKIGTLWYLVADAWYGNQSVAGKLPAGCHLVTRLKTNAVAWHPANILLKRKKGRPRIYGEKVVLQSLFETEILQKSVLDILGKHNFEISWFSLDLLWKSIGRKVRFVLCVYPDGRRGILMSTDLQLEPEEIIRLYVARFQIEVAFCEQVNLIGAYSYRFWAKGMKKLRKSTLQTYLHKLQESTRKQILCKINAYHLFIQIGMVSQGVCQYISIMNPSGVGKNFYSWFRTFKTDKSPSEKVASKALENCLFDFFMRTRNENAFAKFLHENLDRDRMPDIIYGLVA